MLRLWRRNKEQRQRRQDTSVTSLRPAASQASDSAFSDLSTSSASTQATYARRNRSNIAVDGRSPVEALRKQSGQVKHSGKGKTTPEKSGNRQHGKHQVRSATEMSDGNEALVAPKTISHLCPQLGTGVGAFSVQNLLTPPSDTNAFLDPRRVWAAADGETGDAFIIDLGRQRDVARIIIINSDFSEDGVVRALKDYRIDASSTGLAWVPVVAGELPISSRRSRLAALSDRNPSKAMEKLEQSLARHELIFPTLNTRYLRLHVESYYGRGAALRAFRVFRRRQQPVMRWTHLQLDSTQDVIEFERYIHSLRHQLAVQRVEDHHLHVHRAFSSAMAKFHSILHGMVHLALTCPAGSPLNGRDGRHLRQLFALCLTRSENDLGFPSQLEQSSALSSSSAPSSTRIDDYHRQQQQQQKHAATKAMHSSRSLAMRLRPPSFVEEAGQNLGSDVWPMFSTNAPTASTPRSCMNREDHRVSSINVSSMSDGGGTSVDRICMTLFRQVVLQFARARGQVRSLTNQAEQQSRHVQPRSTLAEQASPPAPASNTQQERAATHQLRGDISAGFQPVLCGSIPCAQCSQQLWLASFGLQCHNCLQVYHASCIKAKGCDRGRCPTCKPWHADVSSSSQLSLRTASTVASLDASAIAATPRRRPDGSPVSLGGQGPQSVKLARSSSEALAPMLRKSFSTSAMVSQSPLSPYRSHPSTRVSPLPGYFGVSISFLCRHERTHFPKLLAVCLHLLEICQTALMVEGDITQSLVSKSDVDSAIAAAEAGSPSLLETGYWREVPAQAVSSDKARVKFVGRSQRRLSLSKRRSASRSSEQQQKPSTTKSRRRHCNTAPLQASVWAHGERTVQLIGYMSPASVSDVDTLTRRLQAGIVPDMLDHPPEAWTGMVFAFLRHLPSPIFGKSDSELLAASFDQLPDHGVSMADELEQRAPLEHVVSQFFKLVDVLPYYKHRVVQRLLAHFSWMLHRVEDTDELSKSIHHLATCYGPLLFQLEHDCSSLRSARLDTLVRMEGVQRQDDVHGDAKNNMNSSRCLTSQEATDLLAMAMRHNLKHLRQAWQDACTLQAALAQVTSSTVTLGSLRIMSANMCRRVVQVVESFTGEAQASLHARMQAAEAYLNQMLQRSLGAMGVPALQLPGHELCSRLRSVVDVRVSSLPRTHLEFERFRMKTMNEARSAGTARSTQLLRSGSSTASSSAHPSQNAWASAMQDQLESLVDLTSGESPAFPSGSTSDGSTMKRPDSTRSALPSSVLSDAMTIADSLRRSRRQTRTSSSLRQRINSHSSTSHGGFGSEIAAAQTDKSPVRSQSMSVSWLASCSPCQDADASFLRSSRAVPRSVSAGHIVIPNVIDTYSSLTKQEKRGSKPGTKSVLTPSLSDWTDSVSGSSSAVAADIDTAVDDPTEPSTPNLSSMGSFTFASNNADVCNTTGPADPSLRADDLLPSFEFSSAHHPPVSRTSSSSFRNAIRHVGSDDELFGLDRNDGDGDMKVLDFIAGYGLALDPDNLDFGVSKSPESRHVCGQDLSASRCANKDGRLSFMLQEGSHTAPDISL